MDRAFFNTDAEKAARYAPLEINGIPAWTSKPVARWPDEVGKTLGKELSAQLAAAVENELGPIAVRQLLAAVAMKQPFALASFPIGSHRG